MAASNVATILQEFADRIDYCVIANVKGKTENRSKWQVSFRFKGEDIYRVAFHDDPIVAMGVALYSKRNGQPIEEDVLYWHHAETSSVFKTRKGAPDPREWSGVDVGHIEEINRDDYQRLLLEYEKADAPLIPTEGQAVYVEPPFQGEDCDDIL